jgi:transcriptional regulator GlxA family with amidase domain
MSKSDVPGLEESTSFERRLRRLTKGNIAQPDLPFLAAKLNTSSRSLSRRFAEELQITPGKWIQQQRLEAARVLLESTRLSVSEICFRIGYHDVTSFGRFFVGATGLTPGEFRKELRSATRSR